MWFFRNGKFSRRNLIAGGVGLAAVSTAHAVAGGQSSAAANASDAAVARQEIEYLRRLYAHATDLIGVNTKESIAEGRAIYHRIFAKDAKITTSEKGVVGLTGNGPDEWVKVVIDALGTNFANTQHLIGSQLVQIETLPGGGKEGHATMESYLQAWHAAPDGMIDVFLGTYHDKVRYTDGIGWQIYEMDLARTSGDVRQGNTEDRLTSRSDDS